MNKPPAAIQIFPSRLRIIIMLTLLLFTAGCSQLAFKTNQDLLPVLSFSSRHMIIDNQNSFVWKNVTIKLNDQYVYTTPILPRGPSSLPFTEFRDGQGGVFDPGRSTPHRMLIEVQEGNNGQPGTYIW